MTRIVAVMALAVFSACGSDGPTEPVPSPSPSPTPGLPGAIPGPGSGPTAIALVAADPPLGATIAGCGPDAAGCAGRIRLTFRLTPEGTGTALYGVGFLHAVDKTACLTGRTAAFNLQAGQPRELEVTFDEPDLSGRCRTPLELSDLAMNVVGNIEIDGHQEWALLYRLEP
jgi:hypothetical protein